MKTIIIGILSLITLLFFNIASADVEREGGLWHAVGSYELVTKCLSVCTGDTTHTMNIDAHNLLNGRLSGSGSELDGLNRRWEVTGSVVGDQIFLTLRYIDVNYYLFLNGDINSDGSITSFASHSSLGALIEWETTDSSLFQNSGNHGQHVSNALNKNEAAHQRVGMPVQSNGHK